MLKSRRLVARAPGLLWSLLTCLSAAALGSECLVAQDSGRPVDLLEKAMGVRISYHPVAAEKHIYYALPAFPAAVALIGGPLDTMSRPPSDTLIGLGFYDGECSVQVVRGDLWEDSSLEESLVPAWAASTNSTEPVLAFEREDCPKAGFPRDTKDGLQPEIIEWAAAQIQPQLESLRGHPLDMHPLQGGTWILPDGSRQTWIQLLFGPEGGEWWQGGDRVVVGVDHGSDGAPRLLFRHDPVSGYAAVPMALIDLDDDGAPEMYLDFGVTAENSLYEFQGVAILSQTEDGSYAVQNIIAVWHKDMH